PQILGSLFNFGLFGVLMVQCYMYFLFFPMDRWWMKLFVACIGITEVLQTIFNGYDLYHWFAEGFGDVDGLMKVHLSPVDIPLFAAFTSFSVQIFFCWRI
ncbi:hypothetical protein K488DRAFT_17811, partial [Vararia minispora EC-137]